MKICFLGTSHAAKHLSAAAAEKGFELVGLDDDPVLVFVSEDTPTDANGKRNTQPIIRLMTTALRNTSGEPIILTSQVEPGFTRQWLGRKFLFHQSETLRIKDAAFRASHPEMFIVGCADISEKLPEAYEKYLMAFNCPILKMSYESAEFAKIAINMTLAAQVENANRLAAAAAKVGAKWETIAEVLRHDSRIGPHAYLTPGRWQDSPHLLRDSVTLREIE